MMKMKAEELTEVQRLLKLIRSVPPETKNQIFLITQGVVIATARTA